MTRPKVVLLTTGGTIASGFNAATGDVTVAVSGDALAGAISSHVPQIDIEVVEFSNIGSYGVDVEGAFRLVQRIAQELARDEVEGVVVTHGTDTMEETAFLADILIASDKPVVLTGAQRQFDEADSDGPRNLTQAVLAAASPKLRGAGTVVVFEEEIHAAREVTKTHTSQVRTFQSGEHGKLGEIDQGQIFVQRQRVGRVCFDCTRVEPMVDVIKMVMGADGRLIDAAVSTGSRAIVIEAFGRGNVTPGAFEAIKRAREKDIPVVITSRCPNGRVAPVYGKSGGAGLSAAKALFAGDLSAAKARILLCVLLGETKVDNGLVADFESVTDYAAA